MVIEDGTALVTGGASGLGLATARRLRASGARVVIVDLETSAGEAVADEIGAEFVAGDVTSSGDIEHAVGVAAAGSPLRAVVHCAGRGGVLRILSRDGTPGSLESFESVMRVNILGSFNVLRWSAATMALNELVDGERGVVVLTASAAAFEGQIGQISYAASKAGIHGMTIVAARDLASRAIRVCTIAPGLFDTPMLQRLPDEIRESLGRSVPHPAMLGDPAAFALMAEHLIVNNYVNGETVRLDGALRMAPR
jgi:NAD(P)-dependent dehydrogenase (short-subunit alcohol dehydrogenase family)